MLCYLQLLVINTSVNEYGNYQLMSRTNLQKSTYQSIVKFSGYYCEYDESLGRVEVEACNAGTYLNTSSLWNEDITYDTIDMGAFRNRLTYPIK